MFSLFQKLFRKKKDKNYALNKFICSYIDKAIKRNVNNAIMYSYYDNVNEHVLLCFLLMKKCYIIYNSNIRHSVYSIITSAYYDEGGIRLKHFPSLRFLNNNCYFYWDEYEENNILVYEIKNKLVIKLYNILKSIGKKDINYRGYKIN